MDLAKESDMRKLAMTFACVGGLLLPYAASAADPGVPMDQGVTPPATQKAPTARPGAEGRPASSMFDQLDVNKDGYIDGTEVGRSATVKANFKATDLDGDGRISRAEWEAFEAGNARGQK